MADTERSLSVLLATNFVNGQAAGAITPQDLRDLVISLAPTHMGMYFSTAVETVIATVNTAVKALGTTTVSPQTRLGSMPTNNRLRNDGTATRQFMINGAFTLSTASASKLIGIGVGKNGTFNANSEIKLLSSSTGADQITMNVAFYLELATTDYAEIFLINRTDNSNITIEFGTVNMTGLLE